jgi:hypothetical protein
MNDRITREILAAHTAQLNAGLQGPDAYPAMTPRQRLFLEPLLQLAEQLYCTLTPVQPSPVFVRKLGQELALAATRSQLSLVERYRREILVTTATLGSALSLAGLVLLYLFRQRAAARSTPAS